MKILTKSKQEEIGKLIGRCHYMAELGMIPHIRYEERTEYMTKIIENLAAISNKIGGEDFADAVSLYVALLHGNFGLGGFLENI